MEMTMKALIGLTLAAAAFAAFAGEDSTDRSGIGGTGPAFYATPCGLKGFTGPGDSRPCDARATAQMSDDELRAWMVQHMKVMDETMIRIRDEHRAVMGATRGSEPK